MFSGEEFWLSRQKKKQQAAKKVEDDDMTAMEDKEMQAYQLTLNN
jgi:hypothetical protein